MKYCCQCGALLVQKIPAGEQILRHVCEACDTVHYQNPKIVAGCIPEWEDHILLCRRAIEPQVGYWTFPAGFMENNETTEQAAARETYEEAQAEIEIPSLYAVFTLTHVNQVYMVFRGRLRSLQFGVGHESQEVQLIHPDKIPWDQLAFPVIQETLRRYVEDRARGLFGVHVGKVARMRRMPDGWRALEVTGDV
jgi:ADP-ribose pyrophosphatase YjhB (NUDIX family)